MTPKLLEGYAARLRAKHDRAFTPEEVKDEILKVVGDIATIMSNSQSFGYHEPEDIYQVAYLEALIVLDEDRYDPSMPLENFLYCHCRNQISNLKRKQFFRYEAPCKCCDAFNPGPSPCPKWHAWHKSNTTKQQLMKPLSLTGDASIPAPLEDLVEILSFKELDSYILQRLDPRLADDYELLKAEQPLTKSRRGRIRLACRLILIDSPYSPRVGD